MFAALIGAAAQAEPGLPLESESFTVDVTGNLAEIVFHQRFRNTGPAYVDATYLFPLDNDAVVDAMTLTVGDRVVRSVVYGREEARRLYDVAAAAGKVAAVTEQQRPNVFTQDVANLPPGEVIEVELRVVQPVDRVDGQWTLVVPLVVGPRFFRDDDPAEALQRASYLVLPEAAEPRPSRREATHGRPDTDVRAYGTGVQASIDVVVHAGLPIRQVESPSHSVAPDVVGADASVVVRDVPLTRDFVLTWRTAGDDPAAGLLVAGRHGMLVLEAPVETPFEERAPREVVWVIDTSCSMTGAPLQVAQEAIREALRSMDPRDSFAVLGFGDAVRAMSATPLPATPDNVSLAKQFVGQLHPDGGTYMDRALQQALLLPLDPERRRTVVFVTDGLIGEDEELLREIARRSPEATFVALGVGSAPNRFLLDEMARLGGGVAAYAALGGDPAAEMQGLVDAMDRPVLTGVTVDWGEGCPAHAFAPVTIPDLRPGRPVLLLAKVEQGCVGEVVIRARSGSGTETFRVAPVAVPHGRALASTWARQRVADLERQWMRGEAGDVGDAVREIGLSYGIVTSQTSLLAVDERIVNPGGAAEQVEATLDLPDGLEHTATGQLLSVEIVRMLPAGRSYQSATIGSGGNPNLAGAAGHQTVYRLGGANVTDPVTGQFSANFDFDAVRSLERLDEVHLPERGGGPGAPSPVRSGSNQLEAHAEVAGLAGPTANGRAGASAAGPVVRDRVWFAASASVAQTALDGFDSQTTALSGGVTAQPNPVHRFELWGAGDPSSARSPTASVAWGGGLGAARWEWFPDATVHLESSAHRETYTVGDARRDALGAATLLSLVGLDDPLGGSHRLKFGASGTTWALTTPDRALPVQALDAFAQDQARVRSNLTVAGGVRVDAVEGVFAASPRLLASWDPRSDHRAELSGGYGRTVDPARYLPPELASQAVPVADELWMRGEVLLVPDVTLFGAGSWRRSDFAFAPDPRLVLLPAARVPSIEQRVTTLELGLRKAEARRWSAEASLRLQPAAGPVDEALLRDPSAPFVPGFLDAYRGLGLAAHARWDLPTDPFTTSLGGFARWASAVDAGGPWWLGDVLALGASIEQRFDLRRGGLVASGSVAWFDNDLGSPWLPLEAAVLLPGAPSVAEQPPLRVIAALSYAF
ncbi:MAG: VIT domain-containing protein [Myxococcota bacterium]